MSVFKILQCDSPSPFHGRIYPREEVEKAVKEYQEKIQAGTAFGTVGIPDMHNMFALSPETISHNVTQLIVNDGGEVLATIKILDTPNGKMVKGMVEWLRLAPNMTGEASDSDVVSNLTIVNTSFLPIEENNNE